jgi:DNA-binding transcriptional LysR family regulator
LDPKGKIRRYFKHGMLTQLRVFEAVVRHGGYTRAAAELHLAQPTVSVQMRKLAETVSARLLEVTGRRVRPTPAGQALYEACRTLFETLARLEDVLAGLREGEDSREIIDTDRAPGRP